MENRPQNLFDKLDSQGEQVEDIFKKLEGVSINDLYALAKRTWDYGDCQTAQKYYNHISLLCPLDWEAPLYASLCNFKGYHDYSFWLNAPNKLEKIYISTIKYIYSIDLEQEKKENEMIKCLEIIKEDIICLKYMYLNYKDNFDNKNINYIYSLENTIFNTYLTLKGIKLNCISRLLSDFSNILLDLISKTNKISLKINKEDFDGLVNSTNEKFNIDYDSIYEKCKLNASDSVDDLSFEEIKEIKLNGTMYFEYNDRVISKRMFLRNLIFGTLFMTFSVIGCVYCILDKWIYLFLFAFTLIYGILLIISAFAFRKKIKCSSFLCVNRKKNRLSSNGNIVTEDRFSPMQIILHIGLFYQIFITAFLCIQLSENITNVAEKVIIITCAIISTILYFVSFLKNLSLHMSKYEGNFSYNYKNKNYRF